ncbi:helix-turn-helix domain-containing protein [Leptotrichia sp. HSP-342]|uniref:Helix-turn-helix domain-containing protein n=1 Tax=Leptotrichia mesophila TaxID=3239303 RepID=A0AB39V8S9_9FUSO
MSHKYFTINERNKLEVLLKEYYRISKITQILNRNGATIYHEIKKNLKITPELKFLIEDKFCKT